MSDGDAGNNFLQSIVGLGDNAGGMTESEVNAFAEGAKGLRTMAESGGWAISEEGGTHFKKAVEEAQKSISMLTSRVMNLSEMPRLGNDDYARRVSQHMHEALDSDNRSLLPVFREFQQGLDDLREAIDMARKNFDESDAVTAQNLGSFES
jgi:bacterioferritin (cytochrome b1)